MLCKEKKDGEKDLNSKRRKDEIERERSGEKKQNEESGVLLQLVPRKSVCVERTSLLLLVTWYTLSVS